MLSTIAYLFLTLAVNVKSGEISKENWSGLQNIMIRVPISEYCKNRTCLVKCCPDGYVMSRSIGVGLSCVNLRINYAAFNKYIQRDSSREVKFIHNEILSDRNKTILLIDSVIYISKDGSLKSNRYHQKSLEYCVDFYYEGVKSSPILAFRIVPDQFGQHPIHRSELYLTAGMTISSLLMLLVMMLYAVFPRVQHLTGMMFTTSVLSVIVGSVIKLITLIYTTIDITLGDTASLTVYYFLLSILCWLSLTPFDLWWTVRNSVNDRPRFGRVRRRLHRQGRLKMLWSCLYAWGIPALVTFSNIVIDKHNLYNNISYKPVFEGYAYG